MTEEEIKKLRELIKQATASYACDDCVATTPYQCRRHGQLQLNYINFVQPKKILSLLDELDELKFRIEGLEK